jgi:hypothetical protein
MKRCVFALLALIPLSAQLDVMNMLWRDTQGAVTEVIINSRLHDGARIFAAGHHIYYFSSTDEHNFQGQGRTFQVVGSDGAR